MVPATLQPLLSAVQERLAAVYGDRLQQVYLFGSQARGDANERSDVDLAVILRGEASTFKDGNLFDDEKMALWEMFPEKPGLQFLFFGDNDFDRQKRLLHHEVVRDGIPLLENQPILKADVEKVDKTEEQREHWIRAQNSLRAATNLFTDELYADCMSRAYYAVFHAIEMALLEKDLRFHTHDALQGSFSLHFVKTGELPKEFGQLLNRSWKLRMAGDYGEAQIPILKEQAEEALSIARTFIDALKKYAP